MKYEVRYGALGGQGMVTAGYLLSQIAVKLENKHATASPTYTATVRGGPTKVDVIVSDDPILFPHATALDLCVILDQRPYNTYKNRLKNDVLLVVDSNLVKELGETQDDWTIYPVPIISQTEKEIGNLALTSVVSLAMTEVLTGLIKYDNMVSYVREWAPKKYLNMNLRALELGKSLIENCIPIIKK